MKRGISLFLLMAMSVLDAGGSDSKAPKKEPEFDHTTREPIRIKGRQKAPEFADIDAWLNSDPLTMDKLKGKVVVVHFMAYG